MFELEPIFPRIHGHISAGKYSIPLGTIHGLCEGVSVNIYTNNDGEEEALGRMEIDVPVGLRNSFLRFGSYSTFVPPDPFFATVVGSARLVCFCTDNELKSALGLEIAKQCPGLRINDNTEESCDITVTREQGKVVISRTGANRSHDIPSVTFKDHFYREIPVDDILPTSIIELLCHILSRAAHFYHHLTRRGPEDSKVEMELLQLEFDPDGFYVPLRGGSVMVDEHRALINLTAPAPDSKRLSRPIGMTLHNNNSFGLQPYVFFFNPTNLKIGLFRFVPSVLLSN